ncbi:phage major capsid protein [Dactylosporangium roseum]|uniref:Phage major capsid protein n=1 Tax=Dactylosporangium roseum TaxID=47989 RepID=A0ABY5Z624_9ACTN|nr:phage major capsid protein [Dactylosporangium roseum]UWZ37494.1 phage major capsid protein [Dactylosporangium roseum]
MPITLAQAAINTQNDIDFAVIDNLRRTSWLMDQIVFDDTVSPGTGGGTMTYGYTRLTAAATAGFRALNTEYTPGQAKRDRFTVDLKPLGGAFTLDRVLANLGPAQTNELNFQLQQLLISIKIRFQQEVILGDTAVDANGFDGLSKSLTGTSTEQTTSTDWTPATVNTQLLAQQELDKLDELLSRIVPSTVGGGDVGAPGALPTGVKAILGNTKSIFQLKRLARWASMATSEMDSMGRKIDMYGDWVLVNIGDRQDGSGPIIPINGSGQTDLYAVTFGLDSFHGASLGGAPLLRTAMPDFTKAGAVQSGDVEMGPVAMCLRNTKSAAVFRTIKVQ